MNVKELIQQYEELEQFIGNPELGEKEGQEISKSLKENADEEVGELELYIMNDGKMFDEFCAPAQKKAEAGEKVDWLKIAAEGARRYRKELRNNPDAQQHFTADEIKSAAEYLESMFGCSLQESKEEKPKFKKAEYKTMKIKKPEVEKAPKLNEDEEDDYLDSFEYIYSLRLNGNISDYKERLAELQKDGRLAAFVDYCDEIGVDPELERLDNREGTPDAEEDLEYIYSSLENGNFSQYREQLKRLQANGQLKDYIAYCKEIGVNPKLGKYLSESKVENLTKQYEELDVESRKEDIKKGIAKRVKRNSTVGE